VKKSKYGTSINYHYDSLRYDIVDVQKGSTLWIPQYPHVIQDAHLYDCMRAAYSDPVGTWWERPEEIHRAAQRCVV
jgi:hypothetical protein